MNARVFKAKKEKKKKKNAVLNCFFLAYLRSIGVSIKKEW